MCGRQERADPRDEIRQHLQRVASTGAGNLHGEHDYADRLADVVEAHDHRIHEERVDQRAEPPAEHEQERVHGMHAQEQ